VQPVALSAAWLILFLLDEIMQPSGRISLSRFPADLLGVLLLPATAIFYVVASSLPSLLRAGVFAIVGVAFVVFATRLAHGSRRVERWLMAVIYLLMAVGMFYIAYVEAVLFA
jgi:hypothetical protein